MKIIKNTTSMSPYFNLASEQFLLEGSGDVFMLWRNGRSVIIGKNQNAYSEVNVPFCEENGIDVARRLTGGGAVFHDAGNVNFSFITDKADEGIDFYRFLAPMINALSSFGLNAEADGRNDIICEGFKISGNAQCVYRTKDGRERLLHHGTLLFSADISSMVGALNVKKEKLDAKGVKSVSSRVKNIVLFDNYKGPENVEGFMDSLVSFAEKTYGAKAEAFTDEELKRIKNACDEKFSKWEWNFGHSPEYKISLYKRFPYGTVEINYSSDNGLISEIKITGDFFGERDIAELEKKLTGVRLSSKDIENAVFDINKYINGSNPSDISALIMNK